MNEQTKHYCAQCSAMGDHGTETCPQLEPVRAEIATAQASLKPCPFCGGSAKIETAIFHGVSFSLRSSGRDTFSTGCWVQCQGDCGLKVGYGEAYDDCVGGDFRDGAEALEFWNRRA